jgi:hypothetical protein
MGNGKGLGGVDIRQDAALGLVDRQSEIESILGQGLATQRSQSRQAALWVDPCVQSSRCHALSQPAAIRGGDSRQHGKSKPCKCPLAADAADRLIYT